MRRWLPVLLVLAGAPADAASPAGPPSEDVLPLGLQEALDRAHAHSARLAQLRSLQEAADAGVRGARAGRLPQLELAAGYTRNSSVPELVVGIPGVFSQTVFPNIPDQFRTRAGLTLPLYTGGRLEAGIEAARAQTAAAEHEMSGARSDLTLETRGAYWSLVAAHESERVLSEAVTGFEAHLVDARNRERFGMAARNEVLSVQVERDRAELVRLQAASAAAVANANLLRLVGLPAGTNLRPTELPQMPEATDTTIEPLVARALAARPDAAALRARVAGAAAAVRIARSAALPQAGLSAGFDYARPNPRLLPLVPEWNRSWSVGVAVSWTVFDGGRSSAAAAQAEAQAQAARAQLEDLERRVRLDVTARALELETARAALAVARRNREAARESVRVSRERYREGVALSSDLLDAETAQLRAGLDETQAVIQLRLALASLERALGQ